MASTPMMKTTPPSLLRLLLSLLLLSVVVVAQFENNGGPPYNQCNLREYYAELTSIFPDPSLWTRNQLVDLVTRTHRRVVDNISNVTGGDDILLALIDLYPGADPNTVHLVYRDTDVPSIPAGTNLGWTRDDLWPIGRGALVNTPAWTDVHSKAPADSTVRFRRGLLFYGQCNTVEDGDKCQSPATSETGPTTATDGKIFTPPTNVRGDIARALFYTEFRYQASLGLTLTDCPPFGDTEYGYLSELVRWHMDDPVSPEELARNERACTRWQGNRNPFVDYPGLVGQFFPSVDGIIPGSNRYSLCSDPTESPTATPNACSSLQPGDIPLFLINAADPDQVIFFPLVDIPPEVGALYVTDNAWDGTQLATNEGVMEFEIPTNGITAGNVFGFGEGSPLEQRWEDLTSSVDPRDPTQITSRFALDSDLGDQIFLYCLDADDIPNFLTGFSFSGPWSEDGQPSYTEAESALPPALQQSGSLALPHADNCVYVGPIRGLEASELMREFLTPTNFECSNDSRIVLRTAGSTSHAVSRRTTTEWIVVMMGTLVAAVVVGGQTGRWW